jgi:hypothetical protein
MVAEPADERPRVAPVISVAAPACRLRAQLPAPLPTRDALPHAVHRLQEAASYLAEVAEAARVLHTVGLHVEGGGGGGHQGGRAAKAVQLRKETFARLRAEAGRPV